MATNLIMYYKEGDPTKRRDPDILVALGVGKHARRFFRIWMEGTIPNVLFEIASKRTYRVDLTTKRFLYAEIGVLEYFVFDPVDAPSKKRYRGRVSSIPSGSGAIARGGFG